MINKKKLENEERIDLIKKDFSDSKQELISSFIILNKNLFNDKKNPELREQLGEICSELDEFLSDKQIEQLIDLSKENAFIE
jgi:hypothetical protein